MMNLLISGGGGAKTWKAAVANQAALPASGNTVGDARVASDTGVIYVWTGASWAAPSGAGTVTSVDMSVPSVMAVSGNPITGAGTLAVTFATGQAANKVLATPDGTTGAVAARSLVAADLPTVTLAKGGTGQTTKAPAFDALSPMSASGDIIYGGASGTGTRLAKGSDGQVLTLASGLPSWAAASGSGGGYFDAGNSGSSKTINWAQGAYQKLTMTANCSVTLSNGTAGTNYALQIVQGTGGPFSITFVTATNLESYKGYVASPQGRTDVLTLTYDGTTFYGKQLPAFVAGGVDNLRSYQFGIANTTKYFSGGANVLSGNTGAFSIEKWFWLPFPKSTTDDMVLMSKDDRTTGTTKRMFNIQITANLTTVLWDMFFYIWDNTAGAWIGKQINSLEPCKWYQGVATYDGGTNTSTSAKYYLQGQSAGVNFNSGSFTGITSTNGEFLIGGQISTAGAKQKTSFATMNQVRVWAAGLSAAEVFDLFITGRPTDPTVATANFTHTSPLNWWRLCDLTDTQTTVVDHGSAALNLTGTNTAAGDIVYFVP